VDGLALELVVAGADVTGGLVERDVELAFDLAAFAVHFNVVVEGIHLGAEQADDLAVDGHAAIQDELLGGAARGDARLGEKFLQTNSQMRSAEGGVRKNEAVRS